MKPIDLEQMYKLYEGEADLWAKRCASYEKEANTRLLNRSDLDDPSEWRTRFAMMQATSCIENGYIRAMRILLLHGWPSAPARQNTPIQPRAASEDLGSPAAYRSEDRP